MRVAFLCHSGIGNLIHCTPCLKALRSKYPDAELYLLTWPRAGTILREWKTATVSMQHPGDFFANCEIDHVLISPAGALWDDRLMDVLPGLQNAKLHKLNVGRRWVKHEVEYLMEFAEELGCSGEIPDSEVCLQPMNASRADDFIKANRMEKFICINATFLRSDHWHLKHWGDEKYSTLLGRLHQECPGYKFVFVGDKQDHTTAGDIFKYAGYVPQSVFVNACGWTNDIRDTASLIARSRLIVGNDGGLMHIAAAVQTPSVTIFTFTNPIKNRPYTIDAEEVMVPCELRIECQHGKYDRCQKNGCFDLPVETVVQAVKYWV